MEKYHHADERRDEVAALRYFLADDPEEEMEGEEPADWGDVDPQHHPLSPPDPMDPSAPGSAV